MARVIDYAWNRPSVAALKAAGAVAVCRYLAYDNSNTHGKLLSKAEADGLRSNGIDVVSNWENAGNWAEYSGGQTTGRSHAAEANRQHIACGGPPDRPLYFSTDWNATSTQLGAVAEYYRGVASVIGLARTGAYGGYTTIKYLFDQGVIAWGWQTFAWSSFRDDPAGQIYLHWDRRAQLRQVKNGVQIDGVDCDLDDSQADDFGQWAAKGEAVSENDRTSTMGDRWGSSIAQQQDSVAVLLGDGSTVVVPNLLKQRLRGMADDLAAIKATLAAPLDPAAVASLVTAALIASGTNPLTAADHAGVRADVETVLADYLQRMATAVAGSK